MEASPGWLFNTVVGSVLLPPLNLLLLAAFGLWLSRKRPRAGRATCAVALLLLAFLSTGVGSAMVARTLESQAPPLADPVRPDAEAIVVLGGGRHGGAPEYGGGEIPNGYTLARLRYGAWLQRASGLPVLVSGGAPDGGAHTEGDLMAQVLRDEFGVPVRWVENASNNTAQNAQYSARILREAGIKKIALVTHAMHMPRARRVFEEQGLTVLVAPTAYVSYAPASVGRWLPSAAGLHTSWYAMHEWLGLLWYRLRR